MSDLEENEDFNAEEAQLDVQMWKELSNQVYQYVSNKKLNYAKLVKKLKKANQKLDQQDKEIKQLKEQIFDLQKKKEKNEIINKELLENNANLSMFTEYQNEVLAMKAIEQEINEAHTPRGANSELNLPMLNQMRKSSSCIDISSPTLIKASRLWHFSVANKQNRIILECNNKRAQFPPSEAMCLLERQILPQETLTIRFKMIDNFGFDIGICQLQKDYSVLLRDVGLCLYNGGNPGWLYDHEKVAGRYGKQSDNQGSVEMHIDAKKGTLQYTINGVNYGDAFTGIDFVKNVYYPAVGSQYNRTIEIVESIEAAPYDFSI